MQGQKSSAKRNKLSKSYKIMFSKFEVPRKPPEQKPIIIQMFLVTREVMSLFHVAIPEFGTFHTPVTQSESLCFDFFYVF